MEADSLLTKYRPQTFSDVIGQEKVVKSLKAALTKSVSHAYLFIGPSGCGKTTLARLAAKDLGCVAYDLTEVDAATFTGIDDMRNVTSTLGYKPMQEGGGKGIILDECHSLSKQAWTSLLKSLEEPSAWVYWFLCTTEAGKVPENIKTRCLRYELKPVAISVIGDFLEEILEQEKVNLGKEQGGIIDICAKQAHGSPRQALSNLAVCLSVRTREEAAELLLSAEGAPAAIDFVRALYKGASWGQLQGLLGGLTEMNAEGIRQIVRAYGTKIVLGAKSPDAAGKALEILDAFSEPCYGSDGITPILLSCAKLTLGSE